MRKNFGAKPFLYPQPVMILGTYDENGKATSDMIKELCNKKNISVSELARRIGQTPQNFGKKLKRDTVTLVL